MSLTDPIADGLTMIRNANRVKKDRLDIPASAMMTQILKVLKQEKFIHEYRLIEDKKQGILRVYLKKAGEPSRPIVRIMRVSRPGLRIYTHQENIPTVLSGLGVCVLSTSQGVLSGAEAKRRNVGGEVLLKVW
ncbi:MAG: 30S ribosomal protein S8 [Candidatus Omnitrophica bacterium CG07_land_8_20_14_0_80_50_8]|nr:MAG: 30S ribosomal protein S8 [Candidatus Omnitrophica bacterium CG1_02_49_16]PIU40262.1 MAG: 30S ribosomal protein S8 [Candidatus Omnitrophica bacterium CG07_land_8_20_14_0_80_50_8]